ncbi:MAG: DsbA family protein [Chloroflexi bacterium]|nr:DsbA family protein [Chloroflexota bacterium]
MSRRTEIRDKRLHQRRRNTTIVLAVIAGVALVITTLLIAQSNKPVGEIVTPEPRIYAHVDGQSIGDPNAPVKIDEYSDFQCPYCRVFHDDTLPLILRDYVQTGLVYFTFHNFPVVDGGSATKESTNAAKASVCAAQQGKFFELHDVLFANQTGENIGDFTEKRLYAMAEVAGLNASTFDSCYRDPATANAVDEQRAAGLRAGIESTPSFLVNGTLFIGAQPYSGFQSAINAALGASS